MIMGRRAFMQRSALAAATPAFAGILSLSVGARPLPEAWAAGAAGANRSACKIDGWDRCEDESREHVLIRINQSWKTAWR